MNTIRITRTDSDNPGFRELITLLDAEMTERYGELQKKYNQFNIIESNTPVVVAYDIDSPVGCACFRRYDKVTVEIKRMFLKPGYRGTGIAEKILTELERWASESGYSTAILETAIKQPEAIRFYTRLGYVRIPNYGQYEGDENSICMRIKLVGESRGLGV